MVPYGTTFAPVGSVSLDFRVTAFPYKSSSLATPLKRWDYGCWTVESSDFYGSCGRGKTIQPRLWREEMHPFCRLRRRLPRRGRFQRQETFAILTVNDNGKGKPYNRAFGAREMHPFCLRHLSTGKRLTKFSVALRLPTNFVRLPPRRGRFALRLPLDLISITKHSTARSAPSGGKVVR